MKRSIIKRSKIGGCFWSTIRRSKLRHMRLYKSSVGGESRSFVETRELLFIQMQLIRCEVFHTIPIKSSIFISTQDLVGFVVEVPVHDDYTIHTSAKIIKKGETILVLKSVETFIDLKWRKMKFCLVGEHRMLVFL